jgi:hypothetical protein
MVLAEPAMPAPVAAARPARPQRLSRYAEAALDAAVKAIVAAPAGQQRDTLNREIYSIARLVAGGAVPAPLAIESLRWAATQLRSYDARRPWRPDELDRMVRSAFADGLARPRQPERAACAILRSIATSRRATPATATPPRGQSSTALQPGDPRRHSRS